MNARLKAAYAAHDVAVRELAAAHEAEHNPLGNSYAVGHYLSVVGLVRYDENGGTEGAGLLLRPFGSQPDFITNGLLREAAEIADMSAFVESDED